MSHVKLAELRESLLELCKWRESVVTRCEREIAQANITFDRGARIINREIERLTASEKPAPKQKQNRQRERHLDGLTEVEIAHYHQLLASKKG